MRYLLVDSQNMFHRATHVAKGPIDMRARMAIHITLTAIAQSWRIFGIDHLVVALESRTKDNWRKAYDDRYKENRAAGRAKMTQKEKDDQEVLFYYLNGYLDFMKEKTNASVIRCPIAEADDMIARWVQLHPDDEHVILSTDGDFEQLIAPNVAQYNGVAKIVKTFNKGVFSEMAWNGKAFPKDWTHHITADPEYYLFEKIIRGDAGDNVFSAFPGVRKKSTKDKVGIIECFDDKDNKGWPWYSFMNQKWVDHNGKEHRVEDCYNRNRMLIDLKSHPDNVKNEIDKCIIECVQTEPKEKVGWHFGRFCMQYELEQISNRLEEFARILSARYNESD